MTQIQKRRFAYSFATVSVVASLCLWSLIVATYGIPYIHFEEGNTWKGIIKDTSVSLKNGKQNTKEEIVTFHGAANEISAVETNVEASLMNNTDIDDRNAIVNELDTWEISYAYNLKIPKLHIEAPVLLPSGKYWNQREWNLLEAQMQVGLAHGAVAYPHSSAPGNNGSLIVAGHSSPPDERAKQSVYGSIFSRLPELEIGDEITVTKNGQSILYSVDDITIVPASATEILGQQTDASILKIITCYPIGTTKERLVVTAKQLN